MDQQRRVIIALNEYGRRIGESHHNAVMTDEMVDQIREMREDKKMSYGQIARRLKLKKNYVAKVCRYEIRAQTPMNYKTIRK